MLADTEDADVIDTGIDGDIGGNGDGDGDDDGDGDCDDDGDGDDDGEGYGDGDDTKEASERPWVGRTDDLGRGDNDGDVDGNVAAAIGGLLLNMVSAIMEHSIYDLQTLIFVKYVSNYLQLLLFGWVLSISHDQNENVL